MQPARLLLSQLLSNPASKHAGWIASACCHRGLEAATAHTTAAAAAGEFPSQARSLSAAAVQAAAAAPPSAAADAPPDNSQQQQQEPQPQEQQPQEQQPPKGPKASRQRTQEELLEAAAKFEQLQAEYTQQLSLSDVQDEARLLRLINQAATADQVQAAMQLVRWDKMVRARQQRRLRHLSPLVINALLRAGDRAALGHRFGVQVLQQADELGIQVSHSVCHDVLKACIKQQDYWAVAEAWMYCQVYCADPTRQQLQEEPTGSGKKVPSLAQIEALQQQQQQQEQAVSPQAPLAWASNMLLRVYALGLAGWLQQGCVSPKHEQHVRQQLQQVVQELGDRGATVPPVAKAALELPAGGVKAEGEAAAEPAEGEEGVSAQ